MSSYPYVFEGRIDRYAFTRYAYTVIYLPKVLEKELPFNRFPRLRVMGEIADWPISGAWQPAAEGRRYLLLGKTFLREARLNVGDLVEMRFAIDDQDAVSVPDALAAALSDDDALARAWEALTPGAQRAFAHRVGSAKAEATIDRRVAEVTGMVRRGEKPGPPSRIK